MDSVLNFLIFVPFMIPVVVAQFGERQQWARYVTYGLLIAINLVLLGAAALAVLNWLVTTYMPDAVPAEASGLNWLAAAVAAILTALLACLPLIPAVRRLLARWLPLDPESVVHMTALAFAVYQIGASLGQMALIGNLENLTELGLALDIWDVVLSGLPLTILALLGVGIIIRRNGRLTLQRLGLLRPTWKQLLAAVGVTILLLGFDLTVNLAWEAVDSTGYGVLESVTENLFGGLMTVGGAIALGLSAGISEELLFRGAVQPRLGLLVATFLFAIGHLQYGLTIATLEVFIIGLVLGLMRMRTSTTICILIHAGYNTTGVLMGLLQP
jgi:membrane protease YdiL (CAAX protease family)